MNNSETHSFKYPLGVMARDRFTGFTGLIVARCQWITNCNTYALKPRELKDGQPADRVWFDEPEIEVTSEQEEMTPQQDNGGPERQVGVTNRY